MRRCVPPAPGMRPRVASGKENCASLAEKIKSHCENSIRVNYAAERSRVPLVCDGTRKCAYHKCNFETASKLSSELHVS